MFWSGPETPSWHRPRLALERISPDNVKSRESSGSEMIDQFFICISEKIMTISAWQDYDNICMVGQLDHWIAPSGIWSLDRLIARSHQRVLDHWIMDHLIAPTGIGSLDHFFILDSSWIVVIYQIYVVFFRVYIFSQYDNAILKIKDRSPSANIIDTLGILEAEGREAAWGRERSEHASRRRAALSDVYWSRSVFFPNWSPAGGPYVYSFKSEHFPKCIGYWMSKPSVWFRFEYHSQRFRNNRHPWKEHHL